MKMARIALLPLLAGLAFLAAACGSEKIVTVTVIVTVTPSETPTPSQTPSDTPPPPLQTPTGTPVPVVTQGTVVLNDHQSSPLLTSGDTCIGWADSGFADIRQGTNVTLRDATGAIVGVGSLGAGEVRNAPGSPPSLVCVFPFSLTVPAGAFFSVEVGRRGQVNFSYAEITTPGRVALTLK